MRAFLLVAVAPWTVAGTTSAEIVVDKTVVDRGEVRGLAHITQSFSFTNTGKKTVRIIETRSSCSCSQPDIYPTLVPPGASGTFTMKVNLLGQKAGKHAWRGEIRYQVDGVNKMEIVQLTVDYVPVVSVTPSAVTIVTRADFTKDIVITDRRSEPLTILKLETTSPHLQAEQVGTWSDSQQTRIRVRASKDFPSGTHDERVNVYTDDSIYAHIPISVKVVKRSPDQVSAYPEEIRLRAYGADFPSRLVLVKSSSGEAVDIERMDCKSPAVEYRWARGPGSDATIRVRVDKAKMGQSELNTTLRIYVKSPSRQTLTLPLRAISD